MANTGITGFFLDVEGGENVLTNLAMPVVEQSAAAIAARTSSMASSISSDPPAIGVSETKVGTIVKGRRAIATVAVIASDPHQQYVGWTALQKAIDAGRV